MQSTPPHGPAQPTQAGRPDFFAARRLRSRNTTAAASHPASTAHAMIFPSIRPPLKSQVSAPCGTLPIIPALRKMRKHPHDDSSLPHRAEHSPERFHASAPCGTPPETIFAFPHHAETSPGRFHASAKCGTLTQTISAFRTMRKTARTNSHFSLNRENLPCRISRFP